VRVIRPEDGIFGSWRFRMVDIKDQSRDTEDVRKKNKFLGKVR